MNLEEKVQALAGVIGSRAWQDLVMPTAQAALDVCVTKIANGETLTDAERIRMAGLQWVIGWAKNYKVLAEQFTAITEMRRNMEPRNEGGSPY